MLHTCAPALKPFIELSLSFWHIGVMLMQWRTYENDWRAKQSVDDRVWRRSISRNGQVVGKCVKHDFVMLCSVIARLAKHTSFLLYCLRVSSIHSIHILYKDTPQAREVQRRVNY